MRNLATKRLKLVIATLCIGGASHALPSAVALTLGNVAAQSSLGQPLRLVIPVLLNNGENLSTACLRLVSDPATGDTPQLVTGMVSFEPGTPTSRVVVTTARPMNEPALRVSVQTGCGDTTRRDYVLLFDPPAADRATAPVAIAAESSFTSPPPAAMAPGVPLPIAKAPHDARVAASAASRNAPTVLVARATLAAQPAHARSASSRDTLVPTVTETTSARARRDMVKLVANTNMSSGGFISTANAQPLSMMPTARPMQASSAPTLEHLWPYCAMVLCLGGLAMCFAVMRRQRSQRAPSWAATATHASSRTSEHNNASQNTFAHYSEMTEPAPIVTRKPANRPDARRDPTPTTGELDTLLNDDLIDEDAIRREWAAAASEQAMDIGTDSILKAIAIAEREMRIGSAPPAEVAIDKALEDELLIEPKKR